MDQELRNALCRPMTSLLHQFRTLFTPTSLFSSTARLTRFRRHYRMTATSLTEQWYRGIKKPIPNRMTTNFDGMRNGIRKAGNTFQG
jgi:hypothetical protein